MPSRQIIVVSALTAATDADLLADTRLQTVPRNGFLTFELQASAWNASNVMTVSIELPDGGTPLNNVPVPSSNAALAGVIDERQDLQVTFPIAQGGHCTFSCVETGTVLFAWRVTYTPQEMAR